LIEIIMTQGLVKLEQEPVTYTWLLARYNAYML